MNDPDRHRSRRSGLAVVLAPVDRVVDWGERGPVRGAAVAGLVLGLIGALILGVVSAWEWSHVRGWPVEHARIVKLVATGGEDHCGKSDYEPYYDRTWVSLNPPSPLPAEFTDRQGCDGGSVGDVEDVVRVVHDNGDVHVWVDPATSFADVLFFAGFGGVGGWALGFVVGLLRLVWQRVVGDRLGRGRRRRR